MNWLRTEVKAVLIFALLLYIAVSFHLNEPVEALKILMIGIPTMAVIVFGMLWGFHGK